MIEQIFRDGEMAVGDRSYQRAELISGANLIDIGPWLWTFDQRFDRFHMALASRVLRRRHATHKIGADLPRRAGGHISGSRFGFGDKIIRRLETDGPAEHVE